MCKVISGIKHGTVQRYGTPWSTLCSTWLSKEPYGTKVLILMQRTKSCNKVQHCLSSSCCFLGEANAQHNQDKYSCTFPAMIDDWRMAFHTGSEGQTAQDFPFGFVQVRLGIGLFIRWKLYLNHCNVESCILIGQKLKWLTSCTMAAKGTKGYINLLVMMCYHFYCSTGSFVARCNMFVRNIKLIKGKKKRLW